jgi:hypothetical protein
MTNSDEPEYITVEVAAQRLKVTPRMVNRYGNMQPPRLRSRKAGRRTLYHPDDVEQLAVDLDVANKPAPVPPAQMTVFEPGEIFEYLREKDRQLAEVQQQLNQALIDVGRANVLLEQYRQVERERDELRRQLEMTHWPWWKRVLGRR